MRLSGARFTRNSGAVVGTGSAVLAWSKSRRLVGACAAFLLATAALGIALPSPTKPAGADTPLFASGQVFASVGNSAVNVYNQGSGNPLITRLNDGLQEPYTAGSAFDSSGNST